MQQSGESMEETIKVARDVICTHPPAGKVLFVGLVGSHAAGLASPTSDVDLKGVHIGDTRDVLGLSGPSGAHECEVHQPEGVFDFSSTEVGAYLRLVLRGSGNMLERLYAEPVVTSPAHASLKHVVSQNLSTRAAGHYAGFSAGLVREFQRTGSIKSLLGAFRVAGTGIGLLRTGRVALHIDHAEEQLGYSLAELIEVRRAAKDQVFADGSWLKRALGLRELVERAAENSSLPAEPEEVALASDWLVELRLAQL